MKEKNKLLFHRISCLTILILFILIPIIVIYAQPKAELVDYNAYIDTYYSSLNQTSVDIELNFNRPVDSVSATISFYDSSKHLLETKKINFYSYGTKTAENSYTVINGKVDSYELISYECKPSTTIPTVLYTIVLYLGWLPLGMFIGALLLNYKEYNYNGKTISVYAGWFHHTLRIDGEIFDEHNTLIFYTAIDLSTTFEEQTKIEARISTMNRISLKIDGKLVKQYK